MAELATTALFLDANLQHYYKMEDATDSKGSNNLTNTGSATFTAAKYGNGGNLGTSNNSKWFSRADANGIAGNGDYSISMWVKLTTEIASGNYTLFSSRSTAGASRYWDFYYEYNGGTRRLLINASGSQSSHNTTLGTTDSHHIVVTRNVSGNQSKIYLDSALVVTGAVGSGTDGSNTFGIGAETAGGGNPASAIFDDIGMFDRVLTLAEVAVLNAAPVVAGGGGIIFI